MAVPPRDDWSGRSPTAGAAVRRGGVYGFVDEDGREIAKPQHAIADDFKFGFAQIDADGKSGLIDRNGRIAVEPKHGFIETIDWKRFRVSDERRLDLAHVDIAYLCGTRQNSAMLLGSKVLRTKTIEF